MSDLISAEERVEGINNSLREQLFQKGVKGLKGLAKTFNIADFNNNGNLDMAEFEEALHYAGLFLKKNEMKMLFQFYDKSGDGEINYQEFIGGLASPMNARRVSMVQKVFQRMDRDGSGIISKGEVAHLYNAKAHPSVLKGEKTQDEVLTEFLNGFESGGNSDGAVSWQEWQGYYRDLSASVPSDDYFIAMMEGVWQVREDGALDETQQKINSLCEILKEKVRQKAKPAGALEQTLTRAFKHFDSDESGEVTPDEFRKTLESFGITLSRKELKAFFRAFDGNNSGTITSKEFVGLLFKGK